MSATARIKKELQAMYKLETGEKEDGKFIMVQDSPISVKVDKIPVVYSLDTTGRRIFIKGIELNFDILNDLKGNYLGAK